MDENLREFTIKIGVAMSVEDADEIVDMFNAYQAEHGEKIQLRRCRAAEPSGHIAWIADDESQCIYQLHSIVSAAFGYLIYGDGCTHAFDEFICHGVWRNDGKMTPELANAIIMHLLDPR